MFRKFVPGFVVIALIMGMAFAAPATDNAYAQGAATPPADPDAFPVSLEIIGVIASITPQSERVFLITLQDGTVFLVNPATTGDATLAVGQTVTVLVKLDDSGEPGALIARSVTNVTIIGTLTPTFTPVAVIPSPTPVVLPTQPATPVETQSALCGGNQPQPVAARLADAFGVSYDEIMGWHCRGFGFGEIARAYLMEEKSDLTVEEIFDMRASGTGWGAIIKQSGLNPSELAPGQVIKAKRDSDDDKKAKAKHQKPKKSKGNNGKGH